MDTMWRAAAEVKVGAWVDGVGGSHEWGQPVTVLGDKVEQSAESSWLRGPLLGQGAFGSVSLALSKDTGLLFAVKSVDCDKPAAELEVLENELAMLQAVDSPRVIRCLGSDWTIETAPSEGCVGTAVRRRNVFLEHAPGGSLADLLKKFSGRAGAARGLHEALLRKYTRQVTEGLRDLHLQGIVHGDIKGHNILLTADGCKLCDFGTAARVRAAEVPAAKQAPAVEVGSVGLAARSELMAAEAGGSRVQPAPQGQGGSRASSRLRGTICWMSPEVVREEPVGVTADVWSLGCTVVELATGRSPWGVADQLSALYMIGCREETPVLPSTLSACGLDFLRLCFQRDPAARPTAEDLLLHPFLTEPFTGCSAAQSMHNPPSPSSVFGFPSWASYTSSCSPSASPTSLKGNAAAGEAPPASAASSFTSWHEAFPISCSPCGSHLNLDLDELVIPDGDADDHYSRLSNNSCTSTSSWWSASSGSPGDRWITVHSPLTTRPSATEPWPLPEAACQAAADARASAHSIRDTWTQQAAESRLSEASEAFPDGGRESLPSCPLPGGFYRQAVRPRADYGKTVGLPPPVATRLSVVSPRRLPPRGPSEPQVLRSAGGQVAPTLTSSAEMAAQPPSTSVRGGFSKRRFSAKGARSHHRGASCPPILEHFALDLEEEGGRLGLLPPSPDDA